MCAGVNGIKVPAVVEKLTLVKPFAMSKNVGHNSADNKSEPAKHLADNKEHSFLWSILLAAPKDGRTRKNLEAFFIAKLKPSLNRQEDSNMLTLFRNDVT